MELNGARQGRSNAKGVGENSTFDQSSSSPKEMLDVPSVLVYKVTGCKSISRSRYSFEANWPPVKCLTLNAATNGT